MQTAGDSLRQHADSATSSIVGDLVQQCSQVLKQLQGIMVTYRCVKCSLPASRLCQILFHPDMVMLLTAMPGPRTNKQQASCCSSTANACTFLQDDIKAKAHKSQPLRKWHFEGAEWSACHRRSFKAICKHPQHHCRGVGFLA